MAQRYVVTLAQKHIAQLHPTDKRIGIHPTVFNRLQEAYQNVQRMAVGFCNSDSATPQEIEEIKTVIDMLPLGLAGLGVNGQDRSHIKAVLKRFGLFCDENIRWVFQPILTLEMQELLDCHITEIGVQQRTAESLETYAEIECLRDLLNHRWDEVESFAINREGNGGIPNFGQKALDEINQCLMDHKFIGPTIASDQWVMEQDSQEHIAYGLKEMGLKIEDYMY